MPIGILNFESSPRITNGRITSAATDVTSSLGRGIVNKQNSRPTIENVQVSVYGSARNLGVENLESSSVIVRNSFISTATGERIAVANDSTSNSKVFHSSIVGDAKTELSGVARFINTEVAGRIEGNGTSVCLNSFTPSLVELSRTCQ